MAVCNCLGSLANCVTAVGVTANMCFSKGSDIGQRVCKWTEEDGRRSSSTNGHAMGSMALEDAKAATVRESKQHTEWWINAAPLQQSRINSTHSVPPAQHDSGPRGL